MRGRLSYWIFGEASTISGMVFLPDNSLSIELKCRKALCENIAGYAFKAVHDYGQQTRHGRLLVVHALEITYKA